MEFIDGKISRYVAAHTDAEPELLKRLNRETHLKVLMPRMLSGHYQGRLLSMISKMIRPKRILEIGTYTGYSALCLAEGLQKDGTLITLDVNAELEPMVRTFFEQSPFASQIDYRLGNALDVLPHLEGMFDLVFIDADKKNNDAYYNMVMEKIPSGGFILIDNVLWSGKVTDEIVDKDTACIQEFNQMVQNDERTENIMLPIRDGILLVRKK